MSNFWVYFKNRIKNWNYIILMGSFLLFGLGCGIYFIAARGSFRNIWMSIAAGIGVPVGVIIVEYLFKMKLPTIILVMVWIVCSGGMVLGTLFDFFVKFWWYDDKLHAISGFFIFACGCKFAEKLIKSELKRRLIAIMAISLFFTVFLLVLWEAYEYVCGVALGIDMSDDYLVTKIYSTWLSNSNNWSLKINDITKTVIYYENGQTMVMENGYLDIGYFDTCKDMMLGLLGSAVGMLPLIIDSIFHTNTRKYVVPSNIDEKAI